MQFLVILVRLSITASLLQLAGALRFSSIQMPALVQRATNFWLACQFELAPGQQLYSVKWYRNNEEFYRLLMGAASAGSGSGSDAAAHLAAGGDSSFQQQYFSQPGLNVLMSASNATHVRLLNASLESEGAYACEISSENLSTIRHEREIKVYVLPHVRLSLIGLRSLYAPGERVQLHCSSDFSRPGGALAWFINGHLITTNSRHFELEWRRTSQGHLERVTLALKFKLAAELLLEANQQASEWRNQSLRLSARAKEQQQQQQQQQQLALLKLECRFKLTDVSDVTFNELKVGRAARERRQAAPLSRPPTTTNRRPALAKSQGQQVVQATRDAQSLRRALASAAVGPQHDACALGPLALQPDDPIILQAAGSGESHSEQGPTGDGSEPGADGRATVAREGASLSLDCSTLNSLLAGEASAEAGQPSSVAGGAWPLGPQRRKFGMQTGDINAGQATRLELCADWSGRRRAIISGKYQAPKSAANAHEDSLAVRGRALKLRDQQPAQQQHQVAYVKLAPELLASRLAAEPADTAQVTKSLAQLERQQQQQQQLDWQLRAPPLLEWFINNQEAPRASASYSPELPLVPTPTQAAKRQLSGAESALELDADPLAGAPSGQLRSGAEAEPTLLPSVEYARYFANFDARPLSQHLKLSLKLDKSHFMVSLVTADSQLTLRCTSTQAQVLMTDSLSVAFLPAPPSLMTQNEDTAASVQPSPSWQQRPLAANDPARQKYLHQYSRSSNQKFASANPNHVQEYSGRSELKESSGVASSFSIKIPSTDLLLVLIAQLAALCLVFVRRQLSPI